MDNNNNKTFREMVNEESGDAINDFLSQLPIDQKVLIQKAIDGIISSVETQIVLPIEKAIEESSKESK